MAIVAVIESCLRSTCENSRTLEVVQAAASHDIDALAALLRQAQEEHHIVEDFEPSGDWAEWYARFMLGEIQDGRSYLKDEYNVVID